jgi:hypothetical protein
MKKIIVIVLALAALAQVALAGEFAGTYTEAKAEAAKLGKPLLLDFFAEW